MVYTDTKIIDMQFMPYCSADVIKMAAYRLSQEGFSIEMSPLASRMNNLHSSPLF